MLKDITLGQYFPGQTIVHKFDPRLKILITLLYIITLFVADGIVSYTVVAIFLFFVIFLSHISVKLILRGLKPVVFIIVFTAILNMFYTPGQEIASFLIFTITREGIISAIFMIFRIIFLIMGTSLLTYTTSPIMLTDGIENLLAPLKKIKVPVHELSMMMTIALRFIPTLIEETEKIMNAQKARGADFESGNLIARSKALVPILVPLFISAFRRADELAVAMECRLYRGDVGRTRMRQAKIVGEDITTFLFCIVVFAIVIYLSVGMGI